MTSIQNSIKEPESQTLVVLQLRFIETFFWRRNDLSKNGFHNIYFLQM